jgi:hypothetical protein
MPENGIATYRDAKVGEPPSREFTTRVVAHQRQGIGEGVALINRLVVKPPWRFHRFDPLAS